MMYKTASKIAGGAKISTLKKPKLGTSMRTGEERGTHAVCGVRCAVCGVYAVCCVILHANTDATLSLFLFSYCVILHANTLTLSLFLFSYPPIPQGASPYDRC